MGCGVLTLTDFGVRSSLAVTLAPVVTVTDAALTVATVVLTIAHILHLAIAVRAPRPVAITAVVIALTTVVLARRSGAVPTRGGATAAG
jgi:hypothetical protein